MIFLSFQLKKSKFSKVYADKHKNRQRILNKISIAENYLQERKIFRIKKLLVSDIYPT